MTGEWRRNLVFDTSAVLKLFNKELGYEAIAGLLRSPNCTFIASGLSIHEIVWAVGKNDFKAVASAVSYFEELCRFVPQTWEDATESAILRLKYKSLGLSMADAFILQLGISTNSEIITCDKAWAEVKEAKVRVV